jgi:hypothetical protein
MVNDEQMQTDILRALESPEVRTAIMNVFDEFISTRSRNIINFIPLIESIRSALFIINNAHPSQGKSIGKLRRDAIEAAPKGGLFMEFGVWKAYFINEFARSFPHYTFYGFDSFEGLPEAWSTRKIGHFDLGGELPPVEPNVVLIKGWFNDSLPHFLLDHPDVKVSFIHMDCDLYSSTMSVLSLLRDRLQVGTQIVLDDYMLEPGWDREEHRAFHDFCRGHRVECAYTGWQNEAPSVSASFVLTKV